MEKSQAGRLGILAVLAIGLLLGGNYFMGIRQGPESLLVKFPSGTQMHVEVADNPLMLHAGLAFRESLAADWGMLFIYERPDFHRVSTKEYRFPVDLIWLDEAKRVLLTMENIPGCHGETCPTYGPAPEKDRYIIAARAGFVAQEQLRVGTELRFALQL
jgi:uncharacterized membrane protein (UPF0127 family)